MDWIGQREFGGRRRKKLGGGITAKNDSNLMTMLRADQADTWPGMASVNCGNFIMRNI